MSDMIRYPAKDTLPWPTVTEAYHRETYPAIDPTLPALSTKGKNIVISGAGAGIGAEIAKAFARSGASNIALLGRTEATLRKTKSEIEQSSKDAKVSIYVADISDAASLERAFDSETARSGPVDVLVANAGFLPLGRTIAESTPEEWFSGFEVNVKGNFNLVRAFLPHAAKDAAVLNISTGVIHLPYIPTGSGYHLSKLAAAKLFDYVHHEHPELFVLNIHPGVMVTAMDAKNGAVSEALPHDDSKLYILYLFRTSGINVERREVFSADVDQTQDTIQVMNASRGRCTSSLTYGIIGSINPDRTMTLNVPPSDIVPFLRQTPESLAKVLFWRSMTTAFRAGQAALEQYRRDGRRQWVANQGILTLPFLLEGVETVLKRINFRLSFFEDRVVDADDAGRDLDAAVRLRHTIARHEVRRLLIEQIGSEKVATLATAAAGALEDAKAFASHSWVEQLAARSVCLGAGPQWRREVVLKAFRDSPHLL